MSPRLPSPARRLAALAALAIAVPLALSTVSGPAGATVTPAATPAATPSVRTAPTSAAHPFSNPIWYPVRDAVYVDCVLTNPGCGHTHTMWTMDIVLETLNVAEVPRSPGVYAMGAGILHIENAHGAACRQGASTTFGTTAWIDHGAGVVSRYGHLAGFAAGMHTGTRLAAGQRFATMGTTGKGGNCGVPYLDFQIRHHGVTGPHMQMKTLMVCSSAASTATWPGAVDAARSVRAAPIYSHVKSHYAVWNDIPKRSVDFPANSGACIPAATPASPTKPAAVTMRPSGRGQLRVSWAAPSTSVGQVQVALSEYHPSTHAWDFVQNETYATAPATARSYEFTGLVPAHNYRASVTFQNSAGNSSPAGTGAVIAASPPAKPTARKAYVTQASKTASVHFGWNRSKTYGLAVESYTVGIRRVGTKTWTVGHTTPTHATYYWPHLNKHAKYRMRVRANYAGGATKYLMRTRRT